MISSNSPFQSLGRNSKSLARRIKDLDDSTTQPKPKKEIVVSLPKSKPTQFKQSKKTQIEPEPIKQKTPVVPKPKKQPKNQSIFEPFEIDKPVLPKQEEAIVPKEDIHNTVNSSKAENIPEIKKPIIKAPSKDKYTVRVESVVDELGGDGYGVERTIYTVYNEDDRAVEEFDTNEEAQEMIAHLSIPESHRIVRAYSDLFENAIQGSKQGLDLLNSVKAGEDAGFALQDWLLERGYVKEAELLDDEDTKKKRKAAVKEFERQEKTKQTKEFLSTLELPTTNMGTFGVINFGVLADHLGGDLADLVGDVYQHTQGNWEVKLRATEQAYQEASQRKENANMARNELYEQVYKKTGNHDEAERLADKRYRELISTE